MSVLDGGSAAPPTADVPKSWHSRQCSGGCGRELAARTADPSANVFCGVCYPGRLPLEPVETRHLDALWQPRRRPAYTAVYAYIRDLGNEIPADAVTRNAMIWRAVNGALDALDHSGVAGEPEATTKGSSCSCPARFWPSTHAPGCPQRPNADSPTQDPATTPDHGPAVNVAGGVTVPDEAVGAGAAVLAEYETEPYGDLRLTAMRAAAKVVTATAPLIAAQALRLAAEEIRRELVCCDAYDRARGDAVAIGQVTRAGHGICFWSEAAARINEGRADELVRGGDR